MTQQTNTLRTYVYTPADGIPVSALALPSSTETPSSPGACQIDIQHHTLVKYDSTTYLKWGAIMELNDDEYAHDAAINNEILQSADCTPGTMFGYEQCLREWMRACETPRIRLFMGGDFSNDKQLQCALNAAASVPSKTVYIRTCMQSEINSMYLYAGGKDSELIPPNVLLFLEPGYGDINLTDLPTCHFAPYDPDIPSDHEMFPTTRENITVSLPKQQEEYLQSCSPWWKKPFNKK